jgi:hypothetical protein
MEIHLLLMVWFTAIFFTALSFSVKNNYAFPVIAAIGFITVAMSFGEVTIYGFDTMGNAHPKHINLGDPHTAGMLGAYWWFWGIGMVFILLTIAWVFGSKKVGEET